jgi:non-specific serine/threonine protein kinase
VAFWKGDYRRAVAFHEEALALWRALGHTRGIAGSLLNLGNVAFWKGDYRRAVAFHGEALALWRVLGETWGIAFSLLNLGNVAFWKGDYGEMVALLHEAILLGSNIGARGLMAEGLESLAWVAVAAGQPERAARLSGAAEALREALVVPLRPVQQAGHDQAVQAMRATLGEEAFAAAWAVGRALPLEAAIAMALEADPTAAEQAQ